jgi:hypothetical protein
MRWFLPCHPKDYFKVSLAKRDGVLILGRNAPCSGGHFLARNPTLRLFSRNFFIYSIVRIFFKLDSANGVTKREAYGVFFDPDDGHSSPQMTARWEKWR